MDLMNCEQTLLYFDDPIAPEIEVLIAKASDAYGNGEAETYLLQAYSLAPQQLVVLVALYRYYFYQHRLNDALTIAEQALQVAGQRLGFHSSWQHLQLSRIEQVEHHAIGLLRFYLLVLKASAYLNLRLANYSEAQSQLEKLIELDSQDYLRGKTLLKWLPTNETVIATEE